MIIYLDESGDLGFASGGSSHFVIAFISTEDKIQVNRIVKEIKSRYKIPYNCELKGCNTKIDVKKDLLYKLAKTNIEIRSIIVKKDNILPKLRLDTNILYNYILGLILTPYLTIQFRNHN